MGLRAGGYRAANLAVLGLLGALALLLRQAEVSDSSVTLWGRRVGTLCVHRRLTGKPCPGCGLTRGVALILHGSAREAVRLHPSAPWVAGWLGVQLAARAALALLATRACRFWLVDMIVSLAALAAAANLPLLLSEAAK